MSRLVLCTCTMLSFIFTEIAMSSQKRGIGYNIASATQCKKDKFALNLLALLIKCEAVLEEKIQVPQNK